LVWTGLLVEVYRSIGGEKEAERVEVSLPGAAWKARGLTSIVMSEVRAKYTRCEHRM
jgi:hypothetical protein